MTNHVFERDPAEQLKGYRESRHIRIFVSFLNWTQINIKAGRIWQCNNQLARGWVRHYNERTARTPFWFEKCYINKNVLLLLYISHPHIIYISYCTCLKGITFLPIITIFKLPLS